MMPRHKPIKATISSPEIVRLLLPRSLDKSGRCSR